MSHKPKVLFLCTGNSCRSQMAEGWARQLKRDSIEAFSAGVEPHVVVSAVDEVTAFAQENPDLVRETLTTFLEMDEALAQEAKDQPVHRREDVGVLVARRGPHHSQELPAIV